MKIKDGVKLRGLRPEILVAVIAANEEYVKINIEFVITSCNDGTHKAGSKHFSGTAIDIRTNTLSDVQKAAMTKVLQLNLGAEFDVVLEVDHIHIEYDPKVGGV